MQEHVQHYLPEVNYAPLSTENLGLQKNLVLKANWFLEDAAYVAHFAHFPNHDLVLGYHDGSIKIIKNGLPILFPPTHAEMESMLARSNGNLFTNHADGMLYIWNKDTQEIIHESVIGRLNVMLELNDGTLALALKNGYILRYDPCKKKVFDYIGTSSARNSDILLHLPSGELLSGRKDVGMLTIWNLHTKRRLKLFRTYSDLSAISLIDATHLATSHRNGKVFIWDLISESCVGEVSNQFQLIHALASSTNGLFATGDASGEIKIWNKTSKNASAQKKLTKSAYVHHLAFLSQTELSFISNQEVGIFALEE